MNQMERVDQLLDLLDAWDDLPTMERPTPEEFCKETPELLEEFCQMLRARTAMGAALSGSCDPAFTPQAMMDSIAPDRYGLLHFHDQGGIGWVYVANDSEVDRKVALKCLQPQAAIDPEARSRFFREAAITSTLEHPGVVPVYGVGGNAPGKLPYYAMRFVQGTTMREAIRELHAGVIVEWTSGSAYKLLRSLMNVCDTVSFAHSRHIVHRDLKSANIMLGEYGETLLLDWGLAKRLDESGADQGAASSGDSPVDDFQATRSGATIGTIAFMSPEQALGNWSEVDSQSDLFSLGAILYQLLTGQVPYQGNHALLLAQRAEYTPPISRRPGTPLALNAICCKAMQPEKKKRYPNVEAFKNDLEAFLADEPVLALPDSVFESSQRWLRKHRTLAQVTGIVLLGTTLVLLGFLAQIARQNFQLEQSIENERHAKLVVEDRNKHIKALLVESQTEAYQAQMSLLSQSWNAMHPRRFERALEIASPKVGSPIDPRGPEWWIAWHRAFGDLDPIAAPQGNDLILAVKLVADGQRAAIWTNSQQLIVINLEDGRTLFKAPMPYSTHKLLIRYADEIPVSEDGSTIAVPDQNSIQLWKWDGQSYVSRDKLTEGDNVFFFRFSKIYLSANGETIAATNHLSEVSIWRKAKSIRLPWNHQRAESISVSSNGLMVALRAEKDVSVLRLDIERWQSFNDIFAGEPLKISFGDLNTLIAWNKQSASTWYISQSPFEAVHLWDYPLPPPPVGAGIWNGLREKIIFENGFHVERRDPEPNELVDRHRVRTSALACIGETEARVLIREPAKTFAIANYVTNPNDVKDRIRELRVPHSTRVRSVSFDFAQAAIESDSHQWAVCNFENQLRSWNDPFLRRGPVQHLSWSSEEDLVAVSCAAQFPSETIHEPGQLTAPELAEVKCKPSTNKSLSEKGSDSLRRGQETDETDTPAKGQPLFRIGSIKPSIELKGYQACVSENGQVAASYEQKLGIHIINTQTGEEQKPFQVDSTLSFTGDRAIRLYLWNPSRQGDSSPRELPEVDYDRAKRGGSEAALPPLALPWLLMFQNESWGDPMDEVLEERLRLLVIDYEKKSLVDLIEIDDDKVTAVSIASDGRRLLVGTEGNKVHVWEVTDERELIKKGTISSPSEVRSLLALGESSAFVGSDKGDVLRINEQYQLEGWFTSAHDGPIEHIAASPDGRRLITLGGDRMLRMFDVASRREVFSLAMHSQPTCAAFSPQQTCLAVGDESGRVHIFPVATSDQVIVFEQKRLRSGIGREQSEEAIARELWAGRSAAISSDDLASESLAEKGSDPLRAGLNANKIATPPKGQTPFRLGSESALNTIETLKSEYSQRSVTELRAEVLEAQQLVP